MQRYRKEGKLKAGGRKRICTARDRKTANNYNRKLAKKGIKCEIENHEK